jgi:5,10-methylenetetrahydrofolate reductase
VTTLLETLVRKPPALWLEIAPPRGINTESLLGKLAALDGRVDAINLADNALGKVKMSGLVFASMIKARMPLAVVLNFSCRDRNRFALKSDLIGAAAIGIDAVVALQGDKLPPDGSAGARPGAKSAGPRTGPCVGACCGRGAGGWEGARGAGRRDSRERGKP